jgi:hypothetical protein
MVPRTDAGAALGLGVTAGWAGRIVVPDDGPGWMPMGGETVGDGWANAGLGAKRDTTRSRLSDLRRRQCFIWWQKIPVEIRRIVSFRKLGRQENCIRLAILSLTPDTTGAYDPLAIRHVLRTEARGVPHAA